VNGRPLPLIIDTAASSTGLLTQTAQALGLPRDEHQLVPGYGLGGQAKLLRFFVVLSVQLGTLEWHNLDIIPLGRVADTILPVGVLGTDILSRYDVELDFPGRTMTLYSLSHCEAGMMVPWSGAYQTFRPQRTAFGSFVIPVTLDGHAGDIVAKCARPVHRLRR
jgi:Aspartyl protease